MKEETPGSRICNLKFKDSESVWPNFVRPKKDELLSSWIYRNSIAHKYKPHTFCHLNWPGMQIWNRDIDRCAKESLIASLALKTDTDYYSAYKTVIDSFVPNLFLKHNYKGNSRWVIPGGIYHRLRRKSFLMFCPICFKDPEKQYFKKQWRLSLSVCCPDCRVKLIDRCPACNSSIIFFRTGINVNSDVVVQKIFHCSTCNYDLSASPHEGVPEEIISFQKYLYNSIELGFNNISTYSHLYFAGLSSIINLFTSCDKKANSFKFFIKKVNGIDCFKFINRLGFDFLNIEERYLIISCLSMIMEDWPSNFIEICGVTNTNSSMLLKDNKHIPYWYMSIVQKHFYKSNLKFRQS